MKKKMTQQEKQLLLKDLCARLPYGVNIQVKDWAVLDTEPKIGHINRFQNYEIELKPYLRPMSSMTKEEEKERNNIALFHSGNIASVPTYIDFLNKHHFDYRGLIEKGLALEAPSDMYKTE